MLNSTKSKVIITITIIVLFGVLTIIGINQSHTRQEAEKAIEAKEQAHREAIDKLNEGIVADFSTIVEGMRFDEVIERVGEPYEKYVADVEDSPEFNSETWIYDNAIIVLVNSRVQMISYL